MNANPLGVSPRFLRSSLVAGLCAALVATGLFAAEAPASLVGPAERHAATRHVLEKRAEQRSDLGSAMAAILGTLQVADDLATTARAEMSRRTEGDDNPALQTLRLERHNFEAARAALEEAFDADQPRLESLGRGRDASIYRQARSNVEQRLDRISTLLRQLDVPDNRGAGRRAGLALQRLQREISRTLDLMRRDFQTTTRQIFTPLEEKRREPVRLQARAARAAGMTYTPSPSLESDGRSGRRGTRPDPTEGAAATRASGATITPEITALAAELGNDPLRIYQHVRNNFRFELYFGLLKGAQATLETGAGNDYDLAMLTGALLEAAGYTVRYGRGFGIIPAQDVIDWLGLEDIDAANVLLNTAGITAIPVVVGPDVDHYRVDRVWIEVEASLRPGGALQWLPLDTAFKRHDLSAGINGIFGPVPFDESGYLSVTRPELTWEYYQQQVRDYLEINSPGTALGDVPLGMQVIPDTVGSLPRTLPYRLFSFDANYDPLPNSLKHQVTFRVRHLGVNEFNHSAFLPDFSLDRVTVSYIVNPADQSIVDGFGGLANTPAFAVDVIPQLKFDGTVVAQGGTIPYLDSTTIEMDFFVPGPVFDGLSEHSVRAGDWAALGIDAFQISDAMLQREARTIVEATELEAGGGTADPDELIGALLFHTIMSHHRAVRDGEEETAALAHYRRIRGVSEGMANADQEVISVGGVAFTTIPGSLVVDVPRQIVSNFPLDADSSDEAGLLRVVGFNGSAQEHATWEGLLNVPAISTIKSLQLANEAAIPIFVIDNTDGDPNNDCAILCPQLNLDASTESLIQSDVIGGNRVTVPRDPTPFNDWTGVGFITENTSTGAAGYIISGGLNSANPGDIFSMRRPWGINGGAVVVVLPDGTVLVIPAGDIGDGPGTANTGDPVNIANGNFFREEIDFQIPALGELLKFERIYNSQSTNDGPLGIGWAHNYGDRLFVQPDMSVIWIDGRGAAHTFQPDVSPGDFISPPGLRETLVDTGGGFTMTRYDGRQVIFDAAGLMLTRADRNGNTYTFGYDGSSRLDTVTDPASRSLTLTYNAADKIATVSDFSGRTWNYAYDAADRLMQVSSPSDAQTPAMVTQYDYFPNDLLKQVTEPSGAVRQLRYYTNGRTAQVIDPYGNPMTLAYNAFKGETRVTDESGLTEIHQFNAAGNRVGQIYADGTADRWTWVDNRMTTRIDPLGNPETFEYDVDGNLWRTTDGSGVQSEYLYEPAYQQISQITRPGSRVTAMLYDAQGNLREYRDAENNVRTQTNNAQGLPETIVEPGGATVTIGYDGAGLMTSRTTQLPSSESIAYTPRGREEVRTNPRGHVSTIQYDLLDRRIGLVDAEGYTASMVYDAAGRMIESTDPDSNTTTYEYDLLDRLVRTIHPDGTERTIEYDGLGNVVAETDEVGRRTVHEYDKRHRRTATRLPDGGVLRMRYDAAGRLVSATDPLGNETQYEHDDGGRVTKKIDALGNEIVTFYDGNGNVATETDRTGALREFEYDGNNRLIEKRFEEGIIETLDYDENGNVIDRTRYDVSGLGSIPDDPRTLPASRKRSITYTYDVLNRMETIADGEGGVTTFGYDAVGNVTSKTDPRMKVELHEYDKIDRLVKVTRADGGEVLLTYNGAGQRTSVTIPEGGVYSWTYDMRGRPVSHADPLGNVTNFDYDPTGSLRRKDNPDGSWVVQNYDPNGRLLQTRRSDGTFNNLVYDVGGNVKRALTEQTRLDFTYDTLNRRVTETLSFPGSGFSKTVTMGYDDESRLTSVIDPEGRTLTHARDLAGRLTGVTDSAGPSATVGYTGFGERGSLGYGNGLSATIDYDLAKRPVDVDWTDPIAHFNYVRDLAGNPTTVTESLGGVAETLTLGYDDLSRPTSVTAAINPGVRNETIGYDREGSLTTPAAGVSLLYNPASQPTTDGSTVYTHDLSGNQLRSVTGIVEIETSHDPGNRITAIRRTTGGTVDHELQYTYDAFDRLVEIDDNGSLRRIVHAGQNRLVEYDGAGTALLSYTVSDAIDDVFATNASGTIRYMHRDGIGHVRAVTDNAGVVVNTTHYSMFGRTQATTGPETAPLGFTGRPYDATTGFVDMRARFYDPSTGRFFGRDPIPMVPQAPNPYVYGGNRPLMFVDPLGLSPGFGWLDGLQLVLDLGGLIPVIGEPLDLINAGIYAGRGDYLNAGLSAASAIPIGGWAASGAKGVNKAVNAADAANDVARAAENLRNLERLADVAAATGKLPKIPADDIVVIGRQWDTAVAKDWPGHTVLDMPTTPAGAKPKPGDWSVPANNRWLQQAIDQKNSVYVGSPPSASNLLNAEGGATVFARELSQLQAAGYKWQGDYLIPPP